MRIGEVLRSAADIVMPRTCPVCGNVLHGDERYLCRMCLEQLPRTFFERTKFNAMEQLFAGKTRVERAAAYFWYEKGTDYSRIIIDVKYHNRPKLGRWLARRAAAEMAEWGFFDGIDCMAAVPLHSFKRAARGYNQSEYVARGIGDVTGLELVEALRARSHETQTHKDVFQRMENARDIYSASSRAAQQLAGKHVLIVDDVVTTGATLLACAESLAGLQGIKVSVMTLAAARLDA